MQGGQGQGAGAGRRVQGQPTRRLSCPLQEEHEQLLQAAVDQAEGLEQSLRNAEAVLAERAAQLRDAQVSAEELVLCVSAHLVPLHGMLNLKPPVPPLGPTLQEQALD